MTEPLYIETSDNITHYLYPNAKQPRFLLPTNSTVAIKGLKFYSRLSQRAKFFVSHLSVFNQKKYFCIKPDVKQFIGISDEEAANCVIAFGTSGPYQKHTILRFNQYLNPQSISKIATTPKASLLLKNEIRILQILSTFNTINKQVPIIIEQMVNHKFYAFTQSVGIGNNISPLRDFNKAIPFIRSLHNESYAEIYLSESQIFNILNQRYLYLAPLLSSNWKYRYNNCLMRIDQYKNEKSIFSIAHRDFAPWNMILQNSNIFVFDWEFAEIQYPPLYDLFHFLLMPKAVKNKIKQKDIKKVLKIATDNKTKFKPNIAKPTIQLFLYLLDICSFYLYSNEGFGQEDIIVNQYATLLDNHEKWL